MPRRNERPPIPSPSHVPGRARGTSLSRGNLPAGAPEPAWQIRDPRRTREFYNERMRVIADKRGITPQQAGRQRDVKFAWAQYKLNIEREARQNQAARDYVLANRYRRGELSFSEYERSIMEGRHTKAQVARGHSLIQRPMTAEEYRDAIERNRTVRRASGSYAQALVTLELRPASATWAVGES